MLVTNTLSALIRDPHGPVLQRIPTVPPDTLCTSIIVACELRYGARLGLSLGVFVGQY